MKKQPRRLLSLPTTPPPETWRRVSLCLPDDPEWMATFWGVVERLGVWISWERDEQHTAAGVARHWFETIRANRSALARGEQSDLCDPCGDGGGGGCLDFQPNASVVSYSPNSPFTTPNYTPPGYLLPPWYTNPTIPLPGVQPGDAMVNLLAIPLRANIGDILNVWPRATIAVSGAGELEIEFVSIPQGGIALVSVDGNPALSQLVDLESATAGDLASLSELVEMQLTGGIIAAYTHEVKVTGEGNHTIYVTFLPKISGDSFVGFGGGIRRVSLCGFAEGEGDDMRLRQRPDKPIVLQQEQAGAWIDVFDYTVVKGSLITINIDTRGDAERNRYLTSIDNGTGSGGVNPNAPTTTFAADGSTVREDALCMAVSSWLARCWYNFQVYAQRIGEAWFNIAPTLPGFISQEAAFILSEGISITDYVTAAAAVAGRPQAITDYDTMRQIAQDLYAGLRARSVTQTQWRNAIDALSYPQNPNAGVLLSVVKAQYANRGNFLAFMDALGKAYLLRLQGTNDGACITYTDWEGGASSYLALGNFEKFGDGVFRILTTTPVQPQSGANLNMYEAGIFFPGSTSQKLRVTPLDIKYIDALTLASGNKISVSYLRNGTTTGAYNGGNTSTAAQAAAHFASTSNFMTLGGWFRLATYEQRVTWWRFELM